MENGTDYRTLVKAYAIRFDVLVNGNVSFCAYIVHHKPISSYSHGYKRVTHMWRNIFGL